MKYIFYNYIIYSFIFQYILYMECSMSKAKISFVPFGTELLSWAIEKDRRYHSGDKLNRGIVSYTSALHDLGFFFKKVCTGELRPNSQSVSAWARHWGWDYRKALRFITIVLQDLFNLNVALKKAKVLRARLEETLAKQKVKMRLYMRKVRGTSHANIQNNIENDETEDERLFLDAMAVLAKTNPVYYRKKVKQQLNNRDKGTVTNFHNWITMHKKFLSVDASIVEILQTKRITGYRVINYCKKDENIYHVVFDNYFETDMTGEQIIENAQ